jgi:thiol:disulfide interchange protein DsbD
MGLSLWGWAAVPGQAQQAPDEAGPRSSADLVTAEARLASSPVPAGGTARGALVFTIQDGWHVNAHRPTFDYLIGTQLSWETSDTLAVADLRYPEPHALDLDFAGQPIDVYEGTASIGFTVEPAAATAPGTYALPGRLRVQACNDRTCLQPATVEVALSVPVAEAGAAPQPTEASIPDAGTGGNSTGRTLLRQNALFLVGALVVVLGVAGLIAYGKLRASGETEA